MARFMKMKYGVEVVKDDGMWLDAYASVDKWPRLSAEHPIKIDWGEGNCRGESELGELRRYR